MARGGGDCRHGILRVECLADEPGRRTSRPADFFVDAPDDEGKANGAVALTSRQIIGRHGVFEDWGSCGDFSEVIIYNAALLLDDLRVLSETLMSYDSIE